jgi:hypothetical protein
MAEYTAKNDQLLALERSLRAELLPVKPNQQFIGNLRKRLEVSPIFQQQRRLAISLLTVAIGLVAGLVIFLIGHGFMKKSKNA